MDIYILFGLIIAYLLLSHRSLKSRVRKLEDRLGELPAPPITSGQETASSGGVEKPEAEENKPNISGTTDGWLGARAKAVSGQLAAVFNREVGERLIFWLKDNWFYAVSATSLALAGVFLVQYGNERGLLSPFARVTASIGLGAILIAAGEFLRRRHGDGERSATAYLPSTFSGAGLVALFAGILAARLIYGFIDAQTTFVLMAGVSGLAVLLGWFYGPLLAAVGLIGAMGAPFLVGGQSDAPELVYGYLGLVALIGLLIDAIRRWAWVSVLALVLAFSCGILLDLAGADSAGLIILATALALFSIAVPNLSLSPGHSGPMVSDLLAGARKTSDRWPEFPTFLAGGATFVATFIIVFFSRMGIAEFWTAIVCLVVLFFAFSFWCEKAPALTDLAVLPVLGMFVAIGQQREEGAVLLAFHENGSGASDILFPNAATSLVLAGTLMSAMAAWRSFRRNELSPYWGAAAASIAPFVMVLLEVIWNPSAVIGIQPWAFHAILLAAAASVLAGIYAHRDGSDRFRTAMAVLASLSMITLGCVLVLTETALTIAIAVTLLAAAALDRKFILPPLTAFVQVATIALGYRLIVEPGLMWTGNAPVPEIILVFGGTITALICTYWVLQGLNRPNTKIVLESAILAYTGVALSVLLLRWIGSKDAAGDSIGSYWSASLHAVIWMMISAGQFYRTRAGGVLLKVRRALGFVFAVVAALFLALSLLLYNPLLENGQPVIGPYIFNTLIVAYLLPALVLAASARWIFSAGERARAALNAAALASAVFYVGLAVRDYWRGPYLNGPGTTQAELYTYTVALLVTGALLLYQAIARNSVRLRFAAMAVIGITVIKVFFVDISGLQGLTRVASLLALGLSLAGLAWLNRWAEKRGTGEVAA